MTATPPTSRPLDSTPRNPPHKNTSAQRNRLSAPSLRLDASSLPLPKQRPSSLALPPRDSLPAQPPSASRPRQNAPLPSPERRSIAPSSAANSPKPRVASGPSGYFPSQPAASAAEPKSPAARRPPASRSSSGIDTSHGPPVTLITRGSYSQDVARRCSLVQSPKDVAFAPQQQQQQQHQQLLHLGLVSSPGAPQPTRTRGSTSSRRSSVSEQRPPLSAQPSQSGHLMESDDPLRRSMDDLSENDITIRDLNRDRYSLHRTRTDRTDRTDQTDQPHDNDATLQSEDIFLGIAQDNSQRQEAEDASVARRRSRIARATPHRQSLSDSIQSPRVRGKSLSLDPSGTLETPPSNPTTKLPHARRVSQLPSPSSATARIASREQTPASANSLDQRLRYSGISPQTSLPVSRARDQDSYASSPLYSRRRPSVPEPTYTPPSTRIHKPSNLHYSASRDDNSVQNDTPSQDASSQAYSRAEGTESIDSGPAPSTVWDELDDLKSRIRRIELAGKMPATSAAAVSGESTDRPRTATTTITTISSSPRQQRKTSVSAVDSNGKQGMNNIHPLLHQALSNSKDLLPPPVYRSLEATANEALELVALAGNSGPQGTTFSVASIISGSHVPDRMVRRKADNLCRSLTELCIALCESHNAMSNGMSAPPSPAVRQIASDQRRGSIQSPPQNGDTQSVGGYSSHLRASLEPEGVDRKNSTPSRALSRIEARRTSLLGLNGRSSRESSLEPELPPPTPTTRLARPQRATTSFLRNRQIHAEELPADEREDDETTTLRVPTRAYTDIPVSNHSHLRANPNTSSSRSNRTSRDFSQLPIPLPETPSHTKISSPAPQSQYQSALRRPSAHTDHHSSNLSSPVTPSLLREPTRRYYKQNTPPQTSFDREDLVVRSEGRRVSQPLQYSSSTRSPGATAAGTNGLGRSGSILRRVGVGAGRSNASSGVD